VVVRRGFTHDTADLLLRDLKRVLPRLQKQPEPVHDGAGTSGFHH
jgi:glutamate decarboxylase